MFSERERLIIKVIGCKKMTIQKVSDELFDKITYRPMDAEISVGNSIRRIMKKCIHYKLKWTLSKKRVNGLLVISRSKI